MPTQNNKISFEGQNFYIGLDVHFKSWNVTVLSENLTLKTFNQPPEALALRKFLDENYPGGNYLSAYEVGFCGFSPHYDLIAHGIDNIVFNPVDICDSHKERVRKTDSADSRKIARNLRNKELKPIYVPTRQEMANRNLGRTRSALVKDITRTKLRIKSFLKYHGLQNYKDEDMASNRWSKTHVARIKAACETLHEPARKSMDVLLNLLDFQQRELLDVCRQIRNLMNGDALKQPYDLLASVPGIGFVTASTILMEICHIDRFESTDTFASFMGLVPDTRSSGPKEIVTGVTSRCNKTLRAMLVEASWIAIRTDPALLAAYSKLIKRMAPNRAIIRIARKIANRIYCVLKTKRYYVCSVVR